MLLSAAWPDFSNPAQQGYFHQPHIRCCCDRHGFHREPMQPSPASHRCAYPFIVVRKKRAAARFRTLSASPVTCSPSAVSNCASGSSPSYPSSRIRPRLPSSPMAPKKQSRAKSSADLLPDPDEGDCTDQMWKKIKAVIQKLSENGEYLLPDEDAAGVPGLASLPLGWTGADVPSSETRPGGNQRCSCTRCAKLRLTLNLSSWYHAKASAGSWDACRPLPRQCRAGRSHPFRAGRPAGQRLLVR